MRVGMGYDVHKLVEGRDLILGGVKVPHTLGLLGHSDADVLLHAIMDALLGAAALGDIGKHFPDTDPAYEGISSLKLLEHVRDLIAKKGYVIENIDATVIAQKPKLRPYIEQMEQNVADTLQIAKEQVNIKATTEELALQAVRRELHRRQSVHLQVSMRLVCRSEADVAAAPAVRPIDLNIYGKHAKIKR